MKGDSHFNKMVPLPTLPNKHRIVVFSKIFYWPFQGGTSFVDLLCFCYVLCLLCFVCVCLYVLCGHLLGKGWPLGSRLWCLLWVCHFPIGILGQVWYLIVSIPDLCNLTYFKNSKWLWSENTTITNRRQPRGTTRKSCSTITRHQEENLSKETSSLFPIKMIAILEWT